MLIDAQICVNIKENRDTTPHQIPANKGVVENANQLTCKEAINENNFTQ